MGKSHRRVLRWWVVLLALSSMLCLSNTCLSGQGITTSELNKSQQDIEKEIRLRSRLEKGETILIKKIIVTGISVIPKKDIEMIISPFKHHWLSKKDIQLLVDSIKDAYTSRGFQEKLQGISYSIKKKSLTISVQEAQ